MVPRLEVVSHGWDGQFDVPTFDEVIDLAQQIGSELNRPIGISLRRSSDVLPRNRTEYTSHPSRDGRAAADELVVRAHAVGLLVHVWTLRSEPAFCRGARQYGWRGLEFLCGLEGASHYF